MTEEKKFDDMDPADITEDIVRAQIESLGAKPSATEVQKVLAKIASVEDGARRTLFFATVKQALKKERELHPMVTEVQKKANKYWNEQGARRESEEGANPFEFEDEDDAAQAINDKCAYVWWDGARYVMSDADGFPIFGFKSDAECEFAQYKLVRYDSRGFPKFIPAFDIWNKSQYRRRYEGIGFFPDASKARPGFLNLWRGFAIEPAAEGVGDWSLLRAHIFDNICRGNEEHFEFLMDWMSQMVFEPDQKSGVIVVLRGKMGAGKTKLGYWLMKIIGWKHSVEITQEQHLTGNFNAHIEVMLFILAEEAFFVGDSRAAKALKTIATSTDSVYEYKGKDVRRGVSYCRVMMPTNSDWAVPVEADDRRYFVLDVSPAHVNDKPYFAAIDDQMEAGGAAAFLRDLLARKATFRNMKAIPMTDAKREQIRFSLDVRQKWLKSVLESGQFLVNDEPTEWPTQLQGGAVAKSTVLACYREAVKGHKGPPTQEEVQAFLRKYLGKIPSKKLKVPMSDKRKPHYILPSLAEARAAFLRVTPNVELEIDTEISDDDADEAKRVVPMHGRRF